MQLLQLSVALASLAAVADAGACYPCRKSQCAVALRAAGILDKSSLVYSECAAAVSYSPPAVTSTVTTTAYADASTTSVTETSTVTTYAEDPTSTSTDVSTATVYEDDSNESVTVTSTTTAPVDTITATMTATTTPSAVRVVQYGDMKRRRNIPPLAVPGQLEVSCASFDEYLAGCKCFNVQPTSRSAPVTTVTITIRLGPTATVTATTTTVSTLQLGPTATSLAASSVTSTLSLGPTTTVTNTVSAVVTETPPAETVTVTTTVVGETQTATLSSFLLQPTDEPNAYVAQFIYDDGNQAPGAKYVIVRNRAQAVSCTFHGHEQYDSIVCGDFVWTLSGSQPDIYGTKERYLAGADTTISRFSCAFDGQGRLSCASGPRTGTGYVNDGRPTDVALLTPDGLKQHYKAAVFQAVPV
ncbi:hypothetical protein PG984_016463 [Apiospora sp. TS-2023a]